MVNTCIQIMYLPYFERCGLGLQSVRRLNRLYNTYLAGRGEKEYNIHTHAVAYAIINN